MQDQVWGADATHGSLKEKKIVLIARGKRNIETRTCLVAGISNISGVRVSHAPQKSMYVL